MLKANSNKLGPVIYPVLLIAKERQMINGLINECYLFHGSSRKNVEHILQNGFIIKKVEDPSQVGGALGNGIYTTDNCCKALNYAPCSGCSKRATCVGCGQDPTFCIIVSRVLLGRSQIIHKINRQISKPDPGFDSVVGYSTQKNKMSDFRFTEFAIFDPKQIYPEFVIYCKKDY